MQRRFPSWLLVLGALAPAVIAPVAADAAAPSLKLPGAESVKGTTAAGSLPASLKKAVPAADGNLVTPGTDRELIAKVKAEFPESSKPVAASSPFQATSGTGAFRGAMVPPRVGGGQRHSLFFGAPAPMYLGAMTANGPSGGSGCLWELGTDTPEAYRGNTRYITYGLGMTCTPSWIYGTGQARLMDAKDPLNPFAYELGRAPQFNFRGPTEAHGFAGHTRPSDTAIQYIAGWFDAYVDSGSTSHGFTAVGGSDALECDPTGTRVLRCWFYTKPFPFVPDQMNQCATGTVCDAANGTLATAQRLAADAQQAVRTLGAYVKAETNDPGAEEALPETGNEDAVGAATGVEDEPVATVFYANSPAVKRKLERREMSIAEAQAAGGVDSVCVISFRKRKRVITIPQPGSLPDRRFFYNWGARVACGPKLIDMAVQARLYSAGSGTLEWTADRNPPSGRREVPTLYSGAVTSFGERRRLKIGSIVNLKADKNELAGVVPAATDTSANLCTYQESIREIRCVTNSRTFR